MKTDKLGTKWNWQVFERGNDVVYGYHDAHRAYRIAKDDDGKHWRADVLGMLGHIWEALTSKKYISPKQAAKEIVSFHAKWERDQRGRRMAKDLNKMGGGRYGYGEDVELDEASVGMIQGIPISTVSIGPATTNAEIVRAIKGRLKKRNAVRLGRWIMTPRGDVFKLPEKYRGGGLPPNPEEFDVAIYGVEAFLKAWQKDWSNEDVELDEGKEKFDPSLKGKKVVANGFRLKAKKGEKYTLTGKMRFVQAGRGYEYEMKGRSGEPIWLDGAGFELVESIAGDVREMRDELIGEARGRRMGVPPDDDEVPPRLRGLRARKKGTGPRGKAGACIGLKSEDKIRDSKVTSVQGQIVAALKWGFDFMPSKSNKHWLYFHYKGKGGQNEALDRAEDLLGKVDVETSGVAAIGASGKKGNVELEVDVSKLKLKG